MRPRADRRARLWGGFALVACWITLVGFAGLPSPGLAADAQLLPAEEAFRFGARAIDGRTIEARFVIADGYYLYRDKLRFTTEPPAGASEPSLPPGEVKEDPFFGRVETYRREVLVRIALPAAAAGAPLVIQAESQGCAEARVCYPPTLQKISLALPANAQPSAPFVEATPAKRRWFN